MVFVMARPTRIDNSRFPYARKVVPKDLRAILNRTEFKRPLHGATRAENEQLHRQFQAEWAAQIEAARAKLDGKLRQLTLREVDALCGAWYREQLSLHEDDPGSPEGWEAWRSQLADAVGDYEQDEQPPEFTPGPQDLAEAEGLLVARGC